MTLAVNLANLPNYINSAGQLDASTGLTNQVPVSAGGTGLSSLTSGYYLKGNGTGPLVLQNGIPATDITGSIPVAWSGITGKPTTVAGYGITDAITTSTIATQSVNIANTAYSVTWGNVGGKPTFATVATSGLYSDLSGKPTYATVATTGSYNDLLNKPSIPTSILNLGITDGTSGQVLTTNGAGVFTFTTVTSGSGTYSNTNVSYYLAASPTLTTPTITNPSITGGYNLQGGGTISGNVTFSGATVTYNGGSSGVFTNYGSYQGYGNISTFGTISGNGGGLTNLSVAWASVTGKPTFATVATSGSYTDLTSKPTIPTAVSQLSNDTGYAVLPSQTGNSGKFLTTNGSSTSWASITQGGVTSITAGTGIGVNASTGAVTITNSGVTSLVAGSGISISGSTGAVTITASGGGVTSITAGSGLTVSSSTGAVTISPNSAYNGYGVRTVSTTTPSGGSNGDIWYQI